MGYYCVVLAKQVPDTKAVTGKREDIAKWPKMPGRDMVTVGVPKSAWGDMCGWLLGPDNPAGQKGVILHCESSHTTTGSGGDFTLNIEHLPVGNDGVAKKMATGAKNFNDPAFKKAETPEGIVKIITEGKGKMKGLGEKVNAEQAKAIADYEPAYHRLNEIQKWSALFVVLTEQDDHSLDFLQTVPVARDLDFAAWSRNNASLKSRIDIPFLDRRSARGLRSPLFTAIGIARSAVDGPVTRSYVVLGVLSLNASESAFSQRLRSLVTVSVWPLSIVSFVPHTGSAAACLPVSNWGMPRVRPSSVTSPRMPFKSSYSSAASQSTPLPSRPSATLQGITPPRRSGSGTSETR